MGSFSDIEESLINAENDDEILEIIKNMDEKSIKELDFYQLAHCFSFFKEIAFFKQFKTSLDNYMYKIGSNDYEQRYKMISKSIKKMEEEIKGIKLNKNWNKREMDYLNAAKIESIEDIILISNFEDEEEESIEETKKEAYMQSVEKQNYICSYILEKRDYIEDGFMNLLKKEGDKDFLFHLLRRMKKNNVSFKEENFISILKNKWLTFDIKNYVIKKNARYLREKETITEEAMKADIESSIVWELRLCGYKISKENEDKLKKKNKI